ncbi:helix-turn-helix domain-containing protein [Nonomuraea mesophila]|uniref:helix-turn-helix domain-containing protein n=1 Tax=Nonomuraea mesophila TaxID=2530382 RepID=UPI00140D0870|nr:helix-turn-helix domain-containing protein [Nonomuraea mesophila]
MTVKRKSFAPLRLLRPAQHPDADDYADHYQLIVPLVGSAQLISADNRAIPRVGDVLLHNMARVVAACFHPPEGSDVVDTVMVAFPRPLISLPVEHLDSVLGTTIPADQGIAALLSKFVLDLASGHDSYHPSDGPRLGMVLTDLIAATLLHTAETDPVIVPSNRDALVLRIKAFIQEHLRDPHLSPRMLAIEHHISTSYLHRIFQEQNATVSSYIRSLRLERARRDLADPALRAVPIHSIAAKWCFSASSAFSHAFRRAYGLSPKDFRQEAAHHAPR